MDKRAALVANDHIWLAITVQISNGELGADTGITIDQMRREARFPTIALEFEPPDHRRCHGLRIAVITMRPEAFSGDDVEDTVAIHIYEFNGVELGEDEACFAGFSWGSRDEVFLPAI